MAISNIASGLRPGVCTSTTRPTTPFEGQMIYETDTDMVALWNGSAWRYIAATTPTSGTVLQVVTERYASQKSTGSSTWQDTGLAVSITPKSSSSKILVFASQAGIAKVTNNDAYVSLRLVRNTTSLIQFAESSAYTNDTSTNRVGSDSVVYMDSPSTTSSVTYKTEFRSGGGIGTVYVQVNGSSSESTICAMEIAG